MTKEITLSRGMKALVDDEDFDKINAFKWYVGSEGYPQRSIFSQKTVQRMHVLIMLTPKGMVTDHVNGIKTDNRKENLRVCTQAQNTRNSKVRKSNKSGYKGVVKQENQTNRPYSTYIRSGKIHILIGSYKTPEDAARAYDLEAIKMHGEFACVNFPIENKFVSEMENEI